MIGLAVIAEPLVLLLLTDKWAPTIPYFQWLCFVGIGFPLHLANLNALLSVGRSDVFFRLEVIKKVLVVLNIAITYRWGVSAMIIGQIVNNGLAFSLHAYYTQKHVGYAAWLQCRDLCPFLSGAAVMGLAVYFIPPPMAFGHAGELIFKILLGVVIYGGVALLFRFQALEHLQEILRARRAVTGNPTVATIPAE
jgi:O-antigen/teichoic acid export membrane protein